MASVGLPRGMITMVMTTRTTGLGMTTHMRDMNMRTDMTTTTTTSTTARTPPALGPLLDTTSRPLPARAMITSTSIAMEAMTMSTSMKDTTTSAESALRRYTPRKRHPRRIHCRVLAARMSTRRAARPTASPARSVVRVRADCTKLSHTDPRSHNVRLLRQSHDGAGECQP